MLDRYICNSRSNTQYLCGPYCVRVLSALQGLAHAVLALEVSAVTSPILQMEKWRGKGRPDDFPRSPM